MEMKGKLRIYLDTNIIFGWFKAKIDEERKGKTFVLPERLDKLLESKYDLFVSTLVKVEVSRNLKSELNINSEKINQLWDRFLKETKTIELVFEKLQVDMFEMLNVTQNYPLKLRGAVADLIHIQIAKHSNLKFLTSEDMRILKSVFDNVIIIDELYRFS